MTAKAEHSREAILRAAITRFGRDGYRATAVADIARDAGVSGTLAYAYFSNKEALFLAAVDEDAAAVINEGVSHILEDPSSGPDDWRQTLILALVAAVDGHPLARRLLAGLEPEVTVRVLEIPALAELRKACAERLRTDQAAGQIRTDIDAVAIANGMVTIILSLLMSIVQLGGNVAVTYGQDVTAVFEAAIGRAPSGPGRAGTRRRRGKL